MIPRNLLLLLRRGKPWLTLAGAGQVTALPTERAVARLATYHARGEVATAHSEGSIATSPAIGRWVD